MTKENLIEVFKEHDYDWNATDNDFCIKQYLKAADEYAKTLCKKAFDDGFTCGHYDEQEKTAEMWVIENIK